MIPYAGNRVTDDVAYAFSTSRTEAEKIKVAYGSAISPPQNNPEKKIEVPSVGGRAPRSLAKEMLSVVTSARYQELLKFVERELINLKHELDAKQIKSDLIAGIVLTGGGAQIEDITECAAEIFGPQVRVGSPLNLSGLTDYVSKPQYATVLGLLHHNYNNADEIRQRDASAGSIGVISGIKENIVKFFTMIKNQF